MVKISRLVLTAGAVYQSVQLMNSDEMDASEVQKLLGDDKTLVFNQPGPRKTPKWVFTHADSISLMIIDTLPRRGGGIPFERITVGSASYGPGHIIAADAYGDIGVPSEIIDAQIFDAPLVFVAPEGLFITKGGQIASLESLHLAPKAKTGELPPATSEPLVAPLDPADIQGPTLEQLERAKAEQMAAKDAHGGPLRGTNRGGVDTYSESAIGPDGNPISRDITRGVVQDQGPGREGGPINLANHEFDSGKRGAAVDDIRAAAHGEPGANADRASTAGAIGKTEGPPSVEDPVAVEAEKKAKAEADSKAKADKKAKDDADKKAKVDADARAKADAAKAALPTPSPTVPPVVVDPAPGQEVKVEK